MGFAVQTAKGIFDLVRDDLALVEQEIAAQNAAAIEPVAEIASYLREAGGKRLRPALLLLAAGAAGYRGPGAIRMGAVVEMIHSATLVHDDVIDGAQTRRGRPSTNARWGNHMSVLGGDWLYMQSFEMALRERNFAILDILIGLTQNMVEGELLQLTRLGRMDLTEADATELAYRKTACLFSGCARLGAVLGKQPKDIEEALADYGRNAGLAFQLVDDLLDFTASPEELGQAGAERLEGRQSYAAADFCARGGSQRQWTFERRRPATGCESSRGARIFERTARTDYEAGEGNGRAGARFPFGEGLRESREDGSGRIARQRVPPRAACGPRFHPRP